MDTASANERQEVTRLLTDGDSEVTSDSRPTSRALIQPDELGEVRISVPDMVIRRIWDLCGATTLILLTLPIWVAIVLLIRLECDGPAFFVGVRLGRAGKLFPFLKFRSMYTDADERLTTYLSQNLAAKQEWTSYQKLRGFDPRVTGVGKWLRRSSLDELPQLVNVLLGHMSLVGPRPYLERELPLMGDQADIILQVKPGITGLWQVTGRNDLTFEQRVVLEAQYVKKRTLLLDLWLLAKTPVVLLSRRGAY